jgi:hypothetical protein
MVEFWTPTLTAQYVPKLHAWNGPPQPGLSGDVVHKNGDTNDCSFENVAWKVRPTLRSNDKTHNGNLQDNRIRTYTVTTIRSTRLIVGSRTTPGVMYRYENFRDMMMDIVDIVESPDALSYEGPIVWNYRQDKKIKSVQDVRFVRGFEDWTPMGAGFHRSFKCMEFGLERYQVGLCEG